MWGWTKFFYERRQRKEKMLDAVEEAVVKIEASIESGEKRTWTEYEIARELERTTGEWYVAEAYRMAAIETLRQRYRSTEFCTYIFKPRNKEVQP